MLHQVSFRPFVMILENGNSFSIQHPDNIAFDPGGDGSEGSTEFYVITGGLRMFSTFDAVSSVALLDRGQTG